MTPASPPRDDKLTIIAGVLGGLGIILLVMLLLWLFKRRRHNAADNSRSVSLEEALKAGPEELAESPAELPESRVEFPGVAPIEMAPDRERAELG